MKLIVKGAYANGPAQLYFRADTVVEIDEEKARFLLRDAPDNFEIAPADADADEADDEVIVAAIEHAPADRKMRKGRTK